MILAPIYRACCRITTPSHLPAYSQCCNDCENAIWQIKSVVGAYTIQARRIMKETHEVIRGSQEMLNSATMQLVQSQVNLRTCEALLASRRESLLLDWRSAEKPPANPELL